ncbi:MAG: hypothetical protein ACLU4J_13535 [Butyricimonas paravirosa]
MGSSSELCRGQAEEFVQEQVNITHDNGMVCKWVTLYNFVTYKDDVLMSGLIILFTREIFRVKIITGLWE